DDNEVVADLGDLEGFPLSPNFGYVELAGGDQVVDELVMTEGADDDAPAVGDGIFGDRRGEAGDAFDVGAEVVDGMGPAFDVAGGGDEGRGGAVGDEGEGVVTRGG